MKIIYFKKLFLLKISILCTISGFSKAQSDDHQCIPNFKLHKIPSTLSSHINVCSNVFPHNKSWDDANAICKVNFSYLTDRIYFNSSLHLELTNKSVSLLWVGIRRISNYFVANGTELFEEKENIWGFHWSPGEPRRSDCVALNLTSGSLFTHNCKAKLPFVCENIGISDVYNASLPYLACPEYWNLSIPLALSGRKCVSGVIGPLSQPDAEKFCWENYGRLATTKEYDVLHSTNYLSASSKDMALWVNKQGYPQSCPFKVIPAVNGSSAKERPRNCSMPLPFICVKNYEISNVTVWIGDNTTETYPRMSSCAIEDILTCNINITDNNIEKMQLFRWYKDDIPISSCTSDKCRIAFAKASLKWNRYAYAEETRQGSYHCEVSFYGLTQTYSSPKTNIYFSDIATYVIDIHGIDLNSFVDYSHHNFERKMEALNYVISRLFEKLNIGGPGIIWDIQSISITGRSATMKILIYIHRDGIKDFNDEEMYNQVKKLFEENSPQFQFKGNISVSVNSADVCFHNAVKQSGTCSSKLAWYTSRQATNVIPSVACLDDHNNPVYRECKASSTKKAEWSTFNCSSCKKFYSRFQDLPFHCPEGFYKIKGRNLCFKAFRARKNWHEAYATCSERSSYLINERFDDTGLNEIWFSYKYSFGKIQDFGMKPMKLKYKDVIAENHELHCVSGILEKNTYKLKLKDCNEKISFVCILNPYELVSSVKFAHTWTKVHGQDACYFFDKNASYSWTESRETCKQTFHGADLLHVIQHADHYSYLKKVIHQTFKGTNCQPLSWWTNYTITDAYADNFSYLDFSPYIDLKKTHGSLTLYPDKRIYWTSDNSDSNLKLACEIEKCDDNRPTQAYIEDRTKVVDSSSLRNYHMFLNNFKLKCIPSGWFIRNSMQWYKDGVLLDVSLSELAFNVSATISTQEVLEYQGYYFCSVDQLYPLKRVYSSDYLVKIPGIHTFVLTMVSQNKTYLADCPKYMFDQQSYEDLSLKICFDNNLHAAVKSSYFLLRNVTCNRTHVNITVHIHFEDGEEEAIFKEILNISFHKFSKTCDIDPKISAFSTVSCYRETQKLKNFDITWPTTPVGKIAYPEQMCLTDDGKLLERRCLGNFNYGAHWSHISVNECRSTTSNITKELFHLLNEDIMHSSIPLNALPSLTASPEELKPVDVQMIVQIFENLAEQETLPSDNLDIVANTMSNLIDAKPEIFNEVENSSNQIIENFEHITSVVDIQENININTENIIIDIYPLYSEFAIPNCKILSNGSTKSLFNATEKDLEDGNDIEAGIVLPNSLIRENSNTSDRLVYAVYKKNFLHLKNLKPLSYLIHASLPNTPVYDLGKDEVILYFKLNEKINPSANMTPKCVFWDHSLNSWSYKGCFPRYINESSVLCVCNHLTSFSVVMEIDSTPIPSHHKTILHFITYIGCSLSCIGYCLIIITFICFREWRKLMKNKALFNFSISQFLFLFIFMIGIDQTNCKVFCKIAAILMHYFLLSSFAWMIVLAFTAYLSLVKVFNIYIPCLLQKSIAFAWGIPAIILITILSCNHEYYSGEDFCWLSKSIIVYGVIIPLALMLAVNFIIFGTIFHVNICKRPYLRIHQDRKKLVIARAKALFCTSILLGLSWIFGFLAVGEAKLLFEYLFSITTPLQGFLLAVFFVIRPESTRDQWLRLFYPSSSYKTSPSHTISSMIISQRVDVGRSKYENMLNSVVYRAHLPYTPYI